MTMCFLAVPKGALHEGDQQMPCHDCVHSLSSVNVEDGGLETPPQAAKQRNIFVRQRACSISMSSQGQHELT